MSKSIPTTYTTRQILNYRTLQPVLAGDWIDLADHQNLVWQKDVSEMGGHVFDPAAETTSDTLTQNNETSGGRQGDELNFGGTISKEISGQQVRVRMDTFGEDITVQATIRNEEASNTITTISSTHGSSSEWKTATADIARSDTRSGGDPQYIRIKIEWNRDPASGTAKLWQIRVGGDWEATAAALPTRDAV